MGCNVTAHLTKGLLGAEALKTVPHEFGWRLYHDQHAGVSLIDVFRDPAPKYPFTQDSYSLSWEDLPALASLYAFLDRREIYAREFAGGKDTFLDLGNFDCLERVPAPVASSSQQAG